MNENIKGALQYLHNTGGNCSMNTFLEDHEPIGEMLLADMRNHPERLWTFDQSGNMVLTDAGKAALTQSEDQEGK